MRFDFRTTETKKEYYVVERLYESEWRAVQGNYPSDSVFSLGIVARKRADDYHKKTGEKYRVLRVVRTTTQSYDVDVCCEV